MARQVDPLFPLAILAINPREWQATTDFFEGALARQGLQFYDSGNTRQVSGAHWASG
jgi:hypothetical protein